MKKIIGIEIENFKAYAENYKLVNSGGKNLLFYGENGSGKSSMFRGLDLFFKNSINDQQFEKNIYKTSDDGYIKLDFADYDQEKIVDNTSESFIFSSSLSNNKVLFIQESAVVKGFIDYTDLLKIYLKSEPNPNLFDLIVNNLLHDFIPLIAGSTNSIGKRFLELKENTLKKPWTRRDLVHRNAVHLLPNFEIELRITLNKIFEKANQLLTDYFGYADLEISYHLKPITIDYGNGSKSNWKIISDLRLLLKKNNLSLGNQYKDKLNEARLSSIAICIYLASLFNYPKSIALKLLYLDDIFVGLDSSNRLPILQILMDDFKDFQIFISTYDKTFFQLAKLKLEKEKWSPFEFFVGTTNIGNIEVETPIVLESKNDFDKARFHLFNSNPDYPASANYYRKFIESLFLTNFPAFLFKDSNFENIGTYRLSKYFEITISFLNSNNIIINELSDLRHFIYILLHPLSHYQIDASEYKTDLLNIDKLISKLLTILPVFDLKKRFKFILEKKSLIKVIFFTDKNNKHIYELTNEDNLIFDNQTKKFSSCKLYCKTMYNIDEKGAITNRHSPNKNNPTYNYCSLEETYSKISEFLVNSQEPKLLSNMHYWESFKILKGENWKKLL